MQTTQEAPLIVTLELEKNQQQYFNQLRQTYFPEERNYLDAHLTLFHHLPGREIEAVSDTINQMSQQQPVLELSVTEVKSIGRGVAFVIKNPALLDLHKHLQKQWHGWLTPQDQQKLWPHITVQNKVSAGEAKATFAQLAEDFEPFAVSGVGLQLWKYQGGPWEFVRAFSFSKAEKSYLSG
uniref:2'-5' RNA ligase family protein n=1 Tax=Roseihalotalea indica TaxID=2867963 RepID=A0AA49GSC7_9BACT|nr:2'-5' RNA ligase family protein [Tunicatimonas sp. TK19036]